jgi:hypothetical protein
MNNMKTRFRLTCRGIRGGMFYCVDKTTGKRASLQTTNPDEARQIVEAKNQAERQPVLNLQIAKAYLAGTDNGIATRTWQQALESLTSTKQGANQHRWRTVARDKAFAPLLARVKGSDAEFKRAGGDYYETRKFGGACDVMLSESVFKVIEGRRSIGKRRRQGQREAE